MGWSIYQAREDRVKFNSNVATLARAWGGWIGLGVAGVERSEA